jgi:fructose-specific component phosphotransferase system IIB-like protein
MATTLMPLDPAVSAQRLAGLVPIAANLLPEEVVASRRARRMRMWAIVIVVLVACLCGAWIVAVNREKQAASEDLLAATGEVADLQRAQRAYSPVVTLRNESELLKSQLKTTMANDLDWAAMLSMLRSTGEPMDIVVNGLTGKLNDAEDATTAGSLPSTSNANSIGNVVITGVAPDKEAVAAYVDALAKASTNANPYVTDVASADGKVTFSLTIDITGNALCGRFGQPCTSTGGK